MNDAERRLEKLNQRELRREKADRVRKVVFDIVAVVTLLGIVFWGFGGSYITSKMPDKPVSEFFFSLTEGKVEHLSDYIINGIDLKKPDEDTAKDIPEVLVPEDDNSPAADILSHYNFFREEFSYNMTVLYEKTDKEICSQQELSGYNETLKQYGLEAERAARISYSVRISGKGAVYRNGTFQGTAITVRIDGRWYMMPGTLTYSEVTP